MGAVRQRVLIRLLSFVVVLNMGVGVVAVAVRSGDRPGRGTTQFAGSVGIPLDSENGGVLAGGNFNERRRASGSATTMAPATSATTAPAVPPSSAAPSPTTGRPAATTPPAADPGTTASTPGSPGPTAAKGTPPDTTATTRRPSPAATAAPPATTATSGPATADRSRNTLTDPAGDTFVDGTEDPITEDRADIVRARAIYGPETIKFVVQVQKPSDPFTDERWASESTFVSWSIDTNGDTAPDFDVQYYVDEGKLAGVVSRSETDEPEIVCEVSTADYVPDGYSLTLTPSCLGDPASLSYRVTIFYDTNPQDENADVASDVTPNGGLSAPLTRPGN